MCPVHHAASCLCSVEIPMTGVHISEHDLLCFALTCSCHCASMQRCCVLSGYYCGIACSISHACKKPSACALTQSAASMTL